MSRDRLDAWCQRGIFSLVLIILVFAAVALGAVQPWQFLIVQTLTVAAMFLWLLRIWIAPRPQLLWPPVCWAVLAFLAYAAIRYRYSDIEYVARQELLLVTICSVLFLIVVNHLHRQEWSRLACVAMILLGMVISLVACYQFVKQSDTVWNLHSNYAGRGSGTFFYPNCLAAFLELLIPLAFSFTLLGRMQPAVKILCIYSGLAMIAGVAVTLSRGGWVVTSLGLFLFSVVLLFQRGYRLHGLAFATALLIAGVMFVPKMEVFQRRSMAHFDASKADEIRFSFWQTAWQMWSDHPWWGVGPGHFDHRYTEYRPVKVQPNPVRVHNDYLNLLVDWGAAGTAFMALIWLVLFWEMFRTWRVLHDSAGNYVRKKSNKLALLCGGAVALISILLHSVVDFTLEIPIIALLTATWMALLASQSRFVTNRYWANMRVGLKLAVSSCLVAGISALAFVTARGAQEDHWLRLAAAAPQSSIRQQLCLENAFRAEPRNPLTAWQIGECCRVRSLLNQVPDPDSLARTAITWYQRAIALDPYNPENWLGCGICLDWINAPDPASQAQASEDYHRADELDPNGSFTSALIGRHYVQIGDLAAGRTWFERSLRFQLKNNEMAQQYLSNIQVWLERDAASQRPP